MKKNNAFAMGVPEWLKDVKDKKVFSTVFALIVSHHISGEPFTEDGLKKEIADIDGLSNAQQEEAFELIVSHKA